MTSTGETQDGNSIEVDEGASVTYSVSKEGYETKSSAVSDVDEDKTISVVLEAEPEPTPDTPELAPYLARIGDSYIAQIDIEHDAGASLIINGGGETLAPVEFVKYGDDGDTYNNQTFFNSVITHDGNGIYTVTCGGSTYTFTNPDSNILFIKTTQNNNDYYWVGASVVEEEEAPHIDRVYQIEPSNDLITFFDGGAASSMNTLVNQNCNYQNSYNYFSVYGYTN